MAGLDIAGASRVGKSTRDRAAILLEAHAETRRRLAPSRYQRYGDRYDAELTAWVPTASYHAIFATKLRDAWQMARAIAASAALEASLPPIDADTLAEADAMRAAAWFEPISAVGNARMVAAHVAANALMEAARFGAAP